MIDPKSDYPICAENAPVFDSKYSRIAHPSCTPITITMPDGNVYIGYRCPWCRRYFDAEEFTS